jgi:hypothetical protein
MACGRGAGVPSSLSASTSDRELSEGSEGSVRRGNSFPGLRSGADGALFCAASQREIAESLGGCSSAEVMLDCQIHLMCFSSLAVRSKVPAESGQHQGLPRARVLGNASLTADDAGTVAVAKVPEPHAVNLQSRPCNL